MIYVAIVDDHQVVRNGIEVMLADAPDITVTAEFSDGKEFLEALPRLGHIDVLLLDISMPRTGGFEVLTELNKAEGTQGNRTPAVIIVTVINDPAVARQALNAGASGFLTKDSSANHIQQTIRTVAAGGVCVPAASGYGLETISTVKRRRKETLSERELEVFLRIFRGLTIKEISYDMKLSPKTISTYKKRIMEKLEVETLTELLKIGSSWGLS